MASVQAAQNYASTVLAGIAILLFGFSAGILVRKLVQKLLQEVAFNTYLAKVGVHYNLERMSGAVLAYAIYILTIILFLKALNIHRLAFYTIVGVVLLLIALSFVVWLKDVLPNLAGWHLLLKRQAQAGNRISLPSVTGKIVEIGYFETKIKTAQGDILHVPNVLFREGF
ncbi:MAG: mechanosensitive ion channel domain-containing protein [Nanoarchaeota archaeon]